MFIKLFITDKGDPSVGIFETGWVVEAPVYIKDTNNISEDEKEELEFFCEKMIEVYKEFCDGKCIAYYDYQLKFEL